MRRFAQETVVPISRSRGEIDKLLFEWKAESISWSDEIKADRATLRFLWEKDQIKYLARIVIALPKADDLRRETRTQLQYEKALAGRGKREHRVLLLWIKAALNAVDMGIVSAEAIFLPFFEDSSGHTVAEVALPRMATLLTGGTMKMLGAG